jgi:predicted transposase YbfD/YdcC
MQDLEGAFLGWVEELAGKLKGQVCIDGKVIRGTSRTFQGSKTLQLVNVYATQLGLVVGRCPAEGRGASETKAALQCLESLDLEGTLVSVDAGLGSRRITRRIREKKAHYLTPIKKNQRWSLREAEDRFPRRTTKSTTEKENSHGRIETRRWYQPKNSATNFMHSGRM